jgi:hypothetical protein
VRLGLFKHWSVLCWTRQLSAGAGDAQGLLRAGELDDFVSNEVWKLKVDDRLLLAAQHREILTWFPAAERRKTGLHALPPL